MIAGGLVVEARPYDHLRDDPALCSVLTILCGIYFTVPMAVKAAEGFSVTVQEDGEGLVEA